MRGAMHTASNVIGPWTAALLTAPLFAVLHFTAKSRIAPEDIAWAAASICCCARSRLWPSRRWSSIHFCRGCRGSDFESHARLPQHCRGDRTARRLGGGTAHAAGRNHHGPGSGDFPVVGRFDGLLGYWLVPWGLPSPPRCG